jgi:hypothetical protein
MRILVDFQGWPEDFQGEPVRWLPDRFEFRVNIAG